MAEVYVTKDGDASRWTAIDVSSVAILCQSAANSKQQTILVDSRSMFDYNNGHVIGAINIIGSKLIKRRLSTNAMCMVELLTQSCRRNVDVDCPIIVYDQSTSDVVHQDAVDGSFLTLLLDRLSYNFYYVYLMKGGYSEFTARYPELCTADRPSSTSASEAEMKPVNESEAAAEQRHHQQTTTNRSLHPSAHHHYQHHHNHHHSSLSQPCLPVSNVGPTRILPYLFLGSQMDALSRETLTQNGISYVLNVSTSSPKPPFIADKHFLRIPVNDSYSDKLSPFFHKAFHFIDKVREANGCVLVHCLAGISRSPTLAIAYVMRAMNLTTDEAYRYVKDKRPTISPNFNFLGQLLDFEKEMRRRGPPSLHSGGCRSAGTIIVGNVDDDDNSVGGNRHKDDENIDQNIGEAVVKKQRVELNFEVTSGVQPLLSSPTTALSRLHFGGQLSPLREYPSPPVDAMTGGGSIAAVGVDSASEPLAMVFESGRRVQQPLSPLVVNGRTLEPENRSTVAIVPPVVIRLGSKHCHGALKRPLSEPASPNILVLAAPSVSTTSEGEPDAVAGIRRPLARPRSITLGVTLKPETPCSPSSTRPRTLSPSVVAMATEPDQRDQTDDDDVTLVPARRANVVLRSTLAPSSNPTWSRRERGIPVPKCDEGCEASRDNDGRDESRKSTPIRRQDITSSSISSNTGDQTSTAAAARRSRSLGDITDPEGNASSSDAAVGVPSSGCGTGATDAGRHGNGKHHHHDNRSPPPPWRSFLSPTMTRMAPPISAMVSSGCCGAGIVDALPSGRRSGAVGGSGLSSSNSAGSRSSLLDSPEIIQVS